MDHLEQIAEKIGKHLNVTLWKKKGNRLYINGYGFQTKKCKQSVYIDLDNFFVKCYTDCPSQTSAWCESQSQQVQENLFKYARYARLIANKLNPTKPLHTVIEGIEMEIHNAELSEKPFQGYYTEWREVRIPINRFGKLAVRNRQFAIAFKGTQNTAPKNFVTLNDLGYEYLASKKNSEYMLDPYEIPDFEIMAEKLKSVSKN